MTRKPLNVNQLKSSNRWRLREFINYHFDMIIHNNKASNNRIKFEIVIVSKMPISYATNTIAENSHDSNVCVCVLVLTMWMSALPTLWNCKSTDQWRLNDNCIKLVTAQVDSGWKCCENHSFNVSFDIEWKMFDKWQTKPITNNSCKNRRRKEKQRRKRNWRNLICIHRNKLNRSKYKSEFRVN